jgi:hypothetical protein
MVELAGKTIARCLRRGSWTCVLGFAGRAGIGDASGAALGRVRGIIRGPKPVRALREVSLEADLQPEEPTTDGIISLLSRHDLAGGPSVCSSTARNPTCP